MGFDDRARDLTRCTPAKRVAKFGRLADLTLLWGTLCCAAPRLEAARGLYQPRHEGRGSISAKTSSRRKPPPGSQVHRERNGGGDTCQGLAAAARRADQVLADAGEVVKPPMLKDVPQWRDISRIAEDRLKFIRIAVVVAVDGRQRRPGARRRIADPLPAGRVRGRTFLGPECAAGPE